jgi:hypothetical protein
MPFEQPNFGERRFSVNEDEIRAEGKKKGWSDTEIDAKIISEKGKMEAANRKVSGEAAEDKSEEAVSSLEREFQNRYENDPEFKRSIDEQEEKREKAA